jgi:hypothetical protein
MPGSNSGIVVGYLAGRYPGRIGHLFGPTDFPIDRKPRTKGPFEFCPYALDNGAFGSFTSGMEWSEKGWLHLLQTVKIRHFKPLWALVPDVVSDRAATVERWKEYLPIVRRFRWDAAFAVQDGMLPSDVPQDASVIFVGGSTAWKWRTLQMWCRNFSRVHVGRVNSYRRLWQCHEAGAESCDGTGWFRGDHGSGKPLRALMAYLAESSGERDRPKQMELTADFAVSEHTEIRRVS